MRSLLAAPVVARWTPRAVERVDARRPFMPLPSPFAPPSEASFPAASDTREEDYRLPEDLLGIVTVQTPPTVRCSSTIAARRPSSVACTAARWARRAAVERDEVELVHPAKYRSRMLRVHHKRATGQPAFPPDISKR